MNITRIRLSNASGSISIDAPLATDAQQLMTERLSETSDTSWAIGDPEAISKGSDGHEELNTEGAFDRVASWLG